MKHFILLFLFIISAIPFFQGCKSGNHSDTDFAGESNEKFSLDTAQINTTLRHVKDNRHQMDSAMKLLDTAELLCVKYGIDSSQAEVLFWKGIIRYEENLYDEAIPLFTKAMEIARKNNSHRLHARCLERLASIHLYTDDPYLALKLYYESLSLSEKVGDSSGIARVYNILGYYKGQSGQLDSGVAYLNKALLINQRLGDRSSEIENLGNLGYVYRTNGKILEAESIYQSLVNELVSGKDSISLPVIYYNLAAFRQEDKKNDSAISYLLKALAIAEGTGDFPLLSTLYGNTGEILLEEGKLDSAKVYLEKCFHLSTRTDDVETQLQALSFLIKIDTLTGNSKNAVKRYMQSIVIQDSINQRKLRHHTEASELKYENEKKKTLIETQYKIIHSSKIERLLLVFLFLLAILALILTVSIFILKRRNHQRNKELYENQLLLNELELDRFQKAEELNKMKVEQVEKELSLKDRELAGTAMIIEQKNELLNLISNRIRAKLSDQLDSSLANELFEILSSIKIQINEAEKLNLFNEQFSQIHQGFFEKMKTAHPELTKTELKFCAYLRIHLSSSQIASILNVTDEAIRKTRYRIRKKMNLPPDRSLEAYISEF